MSASTTKYFSVAAKAIIQESARKIFGNLPIVPYRTGYKILKRMPIGPLAINHFPINTLTDFKRTVPEFTTETEERRAEKLSKLKRNGKGPPKKGHGKRASKKK